MERRCSGRFSTSGIPGRLVTPTTSTTTPGTTTITGTVPARAEMGTARAIVTVPHQRPASAVQSRRPGSLAFRSGRDSTTGQPVVGVRPRSYFSVGRLDKLARVAIGKYRRSALV